MIRETIACPRRKSFALAAAFLAATVCLAAAASQAAAQRRHRVATNQTARKPAHVAPALHIMDLMHASRSAIERHTGRPVLTMPDQVNENGYFCHYRVRGNEYVVEYQAGKATSVVLILGASISSPDIALRAAGINTSGRKPAVASQINRVWKGNLSTSGVRFLAVGRTSEGWNEVQLLDDENP